MAGVSAFILWGLIAILRPEMLYSYSPTDPGTWSVGFQGTLAGSLQGGFGNLGEGLGTILNSRFVEAGFGGPPGVTASVYRAQPLHSFGICN